MSEDIAFQYTVLGSDNLDLPAGDDLVTVVTSHKFFSFVSTLSTSKQGKGKNPSYTSDPVEICLAADAGVTFKIKNVTPGVKSSIIGEAKLPCADVAKLEAGKQHSLSLAINGTGINGASLKIVCQRFEAPPEIVPEGDFIVRWGGEIKDDTPFPLTKPSILRDFHPESPIVMAGSTANAGVCITENHQAWWWGTKMSDKLNKGKYLKPQRIPGSEDKKMIHMAVGENHALFVSDTGAVYSIGRNGSGELGLGDDDSYDLELQEVKGLDGIKIVKVFAAAHRSWAVSDDGRAFSWGDAEKLYDYDYEEGSVGEELPNDPLGHSQEDVEKRDDEDWAGTPAQVQGFPDGTEIVHVAGSTFPGSIFVAKDGNVYVICRGQVRPDESGKAAVTPQKIPGIPPAQVAGLGSCHGAVLDKEGSVWVWGCTLPHFQDEGRPELGLGEDAPAAFTPVKLTTIDEPVVDLLVADSNTIALTASGKALRWGKESDDLQSRLNGKAPLFVPTPIDGLKFKVQKLGLGIEETTTLVCNK